MPRKRQNDRVADKDDPVLQMWGVGKDLWAPEGGDAFIARERSDGDVGRECFPQADFQSAAVEPVGKPSRGLKNRTTKT